jgi:hypothetical protein
MMLKVAVTDIGQLTDFDYDRQEPGPARSSGPAGCLAVVALPLAPGDDIESPGHSAVTGGRCLPACQGAWRTCGSFTSWTWFDTASTTQRTIDVPVSDSVPDLSWLAGAPIFIDSKQIGVFYDAVVGPAFRTVELQVTATQTQQLEKSAAGRLGSGLSALFPWLRIDAGLEARRTATKAGQDGQVMKLQPIDSAARQLVQLSLHYLVTSRTASASWARAIRFPGQKRSPRARGSSRSSTSRLVFELIFVINRSLLG